MPARSLTALLFLLAIACGVLRAEEPSRVDPSTMQGKVLCGYQGWFRTPGDGMGEGWRHWSRARRIAPETLTFEMWPDMTEYGDDEKFAVPGFSYPDGTQAHLFSSVHPATVDRHFRWMAEYGIDGAFLQRFLVDMHNPACNKVLANVRASADKHGRVFAIGYDMSGFNKQRIVEALERDWRRLVDDEKLTADRQYLHHQGRPVVFVWGFFPDRFDGETAGRIIDIFQRDDRYRATIIGGCQWQWRTVKDPAWAKAFRRLDVISPWNVGNVSIVDGQKEAATGSWRGDLAEARRTGKQFLPVIYPGFGWTNLQGKDAASHTIPRRGGKFFWRQFVAASELGLDMAYVAMFDEVDEGTAIFKVTNTPPTQAHFDTYEGLPSDFYLRLTAEGTKLLRGERKRQAEVPIEP